MSLVGLRYTPIFKRSRYTFFLVFSIRYFFFLKIHILGKIQWCDIPTKNNLSINGDLT